MNSSATQYDECVSVLSLQVLMARSVSFVKSEAVHDLMQVFEPTV